MPSKAQFFLLLLGLSNFCFFSLVAFLVLMIRRQQRRLQELSGHLEEWACDLRTAGQGHSVPHDIAGSAPAEGEPEQQ